MSVIVRNARIIINNSFPERNILKVTKRNLTDSLEKFKRNVMAKGLPKVKSIHPGVKHDLLVPSGKGGVFKRNLSDNLEQHKKNVMAKGLPKVTPIPGVKHVLVVASGKGGVGKSTTAVNLATSLKLLQPDKNVGLLDLDVFGPSIPLMMNLKESPLLTSDNLMKPLVNYGVKCMSMGFLVDEGAPVIWRGLMVMQALERLFRKVYWKSIDYLIVDTPPGTGDTHLSLIQNIPITGAILITTPQLAAIQVTKRGARMFQKLNVPIIGIVENMSSVTCPNCSTEVQLFGEESSTLAREIDTVILQKIPLQQEISNSTDQGTPVVIAKPDGVEALAYKNIGLQVIEFVDKLQKKAVAV